MKNIASSGLVAVLTMSTPILVVGAEELGNLAMVLLTAGVVATATVIGLLIPVGPKQ